MRRPSLGWWAAADAMLPLTEVVAKALAASPTADPQAAFAAAARSLLDAVGASTGRLYATAFLRAAAVKGRATLDRDDDVKALAAMTKGIANRGRAKPSGKIILDAWATKAMPAAKRRASRLGERALGHVDPGAASAAIVLRALAASL